MFKTDISKCTGDGCEERKECLRFRIEPHEYRQSYAAFHLEQKPCRWFVDLNGNYRESN